MHKQRYEYNKIMNSVLSVGTSPVLRSVTGVF
jgi:hypothetical protein